jgi:hypothetical protein
VFEKVDFFIPFPGAVPELQRRPGPARDTLVGQTPFQQGPRDWGRAPLDLQIGPGGADQYLAMLIDRARQAYDADQKRPGGPDGRSLTDVPQNGIPYYEVAGIATPANNGVETLVLSFRVPFGMRGLITGVLNLYTGPGFADTSGDLTWRIRIGAAALAGAPARNFHNITYTNGSLVSGPVGIQGIQIGSDQTVEMSVTHAVASILPAPNTRIICGLKGYYWPVSSV